MTTQLQHLIAQREALDAQIVAEKVVRAEGALQAAAEIFAGAGIALDEAAAALLTRHNQAARPQRAKVPPKFRDARTGATWTGRGKQPTWFAPAEQQGAIERIA